MPDRKDHKEFRNLEEDHSTCCHMVPDGNGRQLEYMAHTIQGRKKQQWQIQYFDLFFLSKNKRQQTENRSKKSIYQLSNIPMTAI